MTAPSETTAPGDLVVAGARFRRNGFNEWCEVLPESGELYVAYQESDCLDEIERLTSIIEDLVSDMASTAASHDEVYYAWEGIVRRADGMVADIIRRVSAEDAEWDWDVQLPKGSAT